MDQLASISVIPATQPGQNTQAERPTALWVLGGAIIVIAVAAMLADAALTSEQRMAVFMQAGNFP